MAFALWYPDFRYAVSLWNMIPFFCIDDAFFPQRWWQAVSVAFHYRVRRTSPRRDFLCVCLYSRVDSVKIKQLKASLNWIFLKATSLPCLSQHEHLFCQAKDKVFSISMKMYKRNAADWSCPSACKSQRKCLDSHTRPRVCCSSCFYGFYYCSFNKSLSKTYFILFFYSWHLSFYTSIYLFIYFYSDNQFHWFSWICCPRHMGTQIECKGQGVIGSQNYCLINLQSVKQ